MVRLQQKDPQKTLKEIQQVSIPLWFDYNEKLLYLFVPIKEVSIPLWFDYNDPDKVIEFDFITGLNSTMVRLQLFR